MIVADTNLIVYTAVLGSRTEAGLRVRARDADWVAPPLWQSEFRNALVQNVRHGLVSLEDAKAIWETALLLVRDLEVDPVAALDAAFTYRLSGYDAEFVALAEALGVPLVTDDGRVLKACPRTAVSLDDFAAGTPEDIPDASDR